MISISKETIHNIEKCFWVRILFSILNFLTISFDRKNFRVTCPKLKSVFTGNPKKLQFFFLFKIDRNVQCHKNEKVEFSNFRIDKDVQRCDRNLPYFLTLSNLEKLRNIITTYVWENLDIGYMQVSPAQIVEHPGTGSLMLFPKLLAVGSFLNWIELIFIRPHATTLGPIQDWQLLYLFRG